MLESMVEATVSAWADDLVKNVADLRTSTEFSQKEIRFLKPVKNKMEAAESSLANVNKSLEYLENQSRRNNIRVSGISGSPNESWADSEKKVKAVVSEKLDIDLDIERAHRVERRQTTQTSTQRSNEVRPRT